MHVYMYTCHHDAEIACLSMCLFASIGSMKLNTLHHICCSIRGTSMGSMRCSTASMPPSVSAVPKALDLQVENTQCEKHRNLSADHYDDKENWYYSSKLAKYHYGQAKRTRTATVEMLRQTPSTETKAVVAIDAFTLWQHEGLQALLSLEDCGALYPRL